MSELLGTGRAADVALLGLRWPDGDPGRAVLAVEPHLCRADGRFYGGASLAVALAAAEAVSGRPALWSTVQLVGIAPLGAELEVTAEVVASGRSIDQVQVRGTAEDRLVLSAVGACASALDGGMSGTGPAMPEVSPPEASPLRWGPQQAPGPTPADGATVVGPHLVMEVREATIGPADSAPGRRALWARLVGPGASAGAGAMTPAGIGFVADMVPLAVTAACGVDGAGTSLDQTLRVGAPCDSEWVLLDVQAEVAVGGLGHGRALVWSPDGRLAAVATQTARLFGFDELAAAARRPA